MVTAAATIDGNFTPDGLLPYMVAGGHLGYLPLDAVQPYGNKSSCGHVPSGVKLPSMVTAAITIDSPCHDYLPGCEKESVFPV